MAVGILPLSVLHVLSLITLLGFLLSCIFFGKKFIHACTLTSSATLILAVFLFFSFYLDRYQSLYNEENILFIETYSSLIIVFLTFIVLVLSLANTKFFQERV